MRTPPTSQLISKGIFIVKVCILVGTYLGLKGWWNTQFIIHTIECTLDENTCPQQFLAPLESVVATPLYRVDTQELSQEILEQSRYLSEAIVTTQLPGKVSAHLEKATPLAVLEESSFSGRLTILDNGVAVTPQAEDASLPRIILNTPEYVVVNTPISSQRLLGTVTVISGLKAYGIPAQTTYLASDSAIVRNVNTPDFILNPEVSVEPQTIALKLILNQSLQPQPSTIDVRFEKPVIRY